MSGQAVGLGWECKGKRLEQDTKLSPKCVGHGWGPWIGSVGTCGSVAQG